MFNTLPGYRSAHCRPVWQRIRDRFPVTEDQPELPATFEELSGPMTQPPRLEFMERLRVRTWFQSSDKTQLLQLQNKPRSLTTGKRVGRPALPQATKRSSVDFRGDAAILAEFTGERGIGEARNNSSRADIRQSHSRASQRCRSGFQFLPPP